MGQPQPTAGDCHRESHRALGLSSQEGSCRVSTVARVVVPSGLGRAERASDRHTRGTDNNREIQSALFGNNGRDRKERKTLAEIGLTATS
ncbi:unnamed protein product [Lampetra fluviatilis]